MDTNIINLDNVATEKRNSATSNIDALSTIEMVRTINQQDQLVALAVEKALPSIASAIDVITGKLQNGGHLFYIGAGTSGRLGILDAVECPPTFGVDFELVQGIIAGGYDAIFKAKEGAEDSQELAVIDMKERGFTSNDVLVGVAASGRTPYVIGGLKFAKELGAPAIAVACSPNSPMSEVADITICVTPGPEVITGSTRLKAGTAQKMVLNMLSTGTMIKLGKVYGNLMVDVKATNLKLAERARHIVMEATGCQRDTAIKALDEADGKAKTAILMVLKDISAEQAKELLSSANGYLREALNK
jgi:N-acetylmuramic acid 6-phosphate etherase